MPWGRVQLGGTFDPTAVANGNPRLYEQDYNVPAADQVKLLSSVTFNLTNGVAGTSPWLNIMAISGSSVGANQTLGRSP